MSSLSRFAQVRAGCRTVAWIVIFVLGGVLQGCGGGGGVPPEAQGDEVSASTLPELGQVVTEAKATLSAAAGGTVAWNDVGTLPGGSLVVPPGALDVDTEITVRVRSVLNSGDPDDIAYELLPHGLGLSTPAVLTLGYRANFPDDPYGAAIQVFTGDPNSLAVESLQVLSRDPAGRTVTVELVHFSSIFSPALPQQPYDIVKFSQDSLLNRLLTQGRAGLSGKVSIRGTNDAFWRGGATENVLVIHGILSAPQKFHDTALVRELERYFPNVRYFQYPYAYSVRGVAAFLDIWLQKYAQEGFRTHIVAHSLGGLVARQLIEYTESQKFIESLVTIGTPHNGTDVDSVIAVWSWGLLPRFLVLALRKYALADDDLQLGLVKPFPVPSTPYYVVYATDDTVIEDDDSERAADLDNVRDQFPRDNPGESDGIARHTNLPNVKGVPEKVREWLVDRQPRIVSSEIPSGVEGQQYEQSLESTLEPQQGLTWSATGLPDGINLSPDGVISGTPTTTGLSWIEITLETPEGRTDVATMGLLVVNPSIGRVLRTLNVSSNQPDVPVRVDTIAVAGDRDGAAPFVREYEDSSTVKISAPGTAADGVFDRWVSEGKTVSQDRTIEIPLDSDKEVTAIYLTGAGATPVVSGFDWPVGDVDGSGYNNEANPFGAYGKVKYAKYHLGADLNGNGGGSTDKGQPVYAVAEGEVVLAADLGESWGNVIILRHRLPDGQLIDSLYAHLDTVEVQSGTVARRERIGTIGDANGYYPDEAHLHLEIRVRPALRIVNPYDSYLREGWVDPIAYIERRRDMSSFLLPDLSIAAAPLAFKRFDPGTSGHKVDIAVSRTGGALENGQYVVAGLYLSRDPSFDGFDLPLWQSDNLRPDFGRSTLDTTGTRQAEAVFAIPSNLPSGTWYMLAVVDRNEVLGAEGYYEEADETNNVSAYPVVIGAPPPGEWVRRAGGSLCELAGGLALLTDGSVVMAGAFQGNAQFGATTLNVVGTTDAFLARYNADGTLAWVRQAGGLFGETMGHDVAVLSDGTFVVTGSFDASTTFGAGEANQTTLTSVGATDIFLARYSSSGTLLWARQAGGPGQDVGSGLVSLDTGEFAVTGRFGAQFPSVVGASATFGAGEQNQTVLNSAGTFDAFVARYATSGSLVWAVARGGAGLDAGADVTQLPNGQLVVVGEQDQQAWIGVYKAAGGFVGASFWGNLSSAFGVASFGDGSFVASGWVDTKPGPGALNLDIVIRRYNADGSQAWQHVIGSFGNDLGFRVASMPDGTCVLTGLFSGSVTFGLGEPGEVTLHSPGPGDSDVFVARFGVDGTLQWITQGGGASGALCMLSDRLSVRVDTGVDVAALSDGTVIVNGVFEGTGLFTPGVLVSSGGSDIFLARYNTSE